MVAYSEKNSGMKILASFSGSPLTLGRAWERGYEYPVENTKHQFFFSSLSSEPNRHEGLKKAELFWITIWLSLSLSLSLFPDQKRWSDDVPWSWTAGLLPHPQPQSTEGKDTSYSV